MYLVPMCMPGLFFFFCVRGELQLYARVPCFRSVIHYAAIFLSCPKKLPGDFSPFLNDWYAPSAHLQRSFAGSLLRVEVSSPTRTRRCRARLRAILTPPLTYPPPLPPPAPAVPLLLWTVWHARGAQLALTLHMLDRMTGSLPTMNLN
ncbi:hypothetical protein LX36DRAFT_428883 [Colletotrichum falcatum]|nr:hypothetical protein LX36DRAFT_428883 [Colletotrichum falcatum]